MRTTSTIYQGDCLKRLKQLPDNSVHAVITSPPYWGGLRDYNIDGQLGLEATPQEHIANMVDIAREVFRVLHPSGVFYMNYGDMFATGAGSARVADGDRWGKHNHLVDTGVIPTNQPNRMKLPGLKAKDLVGMPWELVTMFCFRELGFYWRCPIIWHKPNAQTTSAEDRPNIDWEPVLMFTKKEHYFWDRDAIRIRTGNESTWEEYAQADGRMHFHEDDDSAGLLQKKNPNYKVLTHPLGRTRRAVWSICTERVDLSEFGIDKEHFARFPTELVELLIKSGSSERGCCPACLQPWEKIFEILVVQEDSGKRARADAPGSKLSATSMLRTGKKKVKKPIGWKQACKCPPAEPIPSVVLDCFNGTGTTGLVAARLNRSYVGIEIDPDWTELTRRRLLKEMPIFNTVEVINA